MHHVQSMGRKVMERDNARYGEGQSCRNLRVAHISDMLDALHFQIVNFRVKSLAYLAGAARKIDHQAV